MILLLADSLLPGEAIQADEVAIRISLANMGFADTDIFKSTSFQPPRKFT